MKILILFSAIFCLLFSCKKSPEKSETTGCYTLSQVDGWTKINFKSNYTIQVPDEFEGMGMVGFEGYTFSKHSADNNISLEYSFCDNGLFCFDFGDTLTIPKPNTVKTLIYPGMSTTTNDIEYFCQNSDTIGVFYYIHDEQTNRSLGSLFWRDNNLFKEALNINFPLTDFATVNKIIGSIKGK